ncbi:hypothetical protein BCR39DRAFT_320223 [Naematelia encephala]|uniref:Uncharacterized protein n=1 Tax=Naematelia encephala TaxID=71784 RepID=A0A1Y2AQ29_9TREE|nr:hypothetical protein BCR39DRAFT_320223 [Naematelia encephala]
MGLPLPSLPSLPALPSLSALLDPSPPVFYPSRSRRPSTSSLSSAPTLAEDCPALHASASANRLTGEWKPLARRTSVTSLRSTSSSPAIARPSHRRAHSAIPSGRIPLPLPIKPYHAGSSAISLPTLSEIDQVNHSDSSSSSSYSSSFSFSAQLSGAETPPSPVSIASPASFKCSVPPPLPAGTMPPPPRPQTFNQRRASVSGISDVNVLARWSFPSSPSDTAEEHTSVDPEDMGDDREGSLKGRLRRLSRLDTSMPPPPLPHRASTPTHPPTFSSPATPPRRHLPPHLTHRHTLSSPGAMHASASLPSSLHTLGADHADVNKSRPRRPTTSRLRQPNLLSMPNPSGEIIDSIRGRTFEKRISASSDLDVAMRPPGYSTSLPRDAHGASNLLSVGGGRPVGWRNRLAAIRLHGGYRSMSDIREVSGGAMVNNGNGGIGIGIGGSDVNRNRNAVTDTEGGELDQEEYIDFDDI